MFMHAGVGSACASSSAGSEARRAGPRPRIAGLAAPLLVGLNLVAVLYLVGHWSVPLASQVDVSAWAIGGLLAIALALSGLGLVPAALVAVAAGAVLGTIAGAGFVFAGATVISSAGFATSRALGAEFFDRHFGRREVVRAMDGVIARRGGAGLWLLRFAPALPFAYLHFALGQTRVRGAQFAASSLAMLPWIFFCCYCGEVLRDAEQLTSASSAAFATMFPIVFVAIALARVAVDSACRSLASAAANDSLH